MIKFWYAVGEVEQTRFDEQGESSASIWEESVGITNETR
jgi:hypothetical protein